MKTHNNATEQLSLTLQEASRSTGLSIRTLYILIAGGKLQSITVGRRRLVLYRSLKELVLSKAVSPNTR